MAAKKTRKSKKSIVKASAKATAKASVRAGRNLVVVQGSSSSGGGGSSSGGAAGGYAMPMPMPFPNGMQMGAAPVSDWGSQHQQYRNELAESIAANDKVHQKIADRFGDQISELRREQAELAGRVKASHQGLFDDRAMLGQQLGQLGAYTSERFGTIFDSLQHLHDRPPVHNHHHHHPQPDAGDVFAMAIAADSERFLAGEAIKNDQGNTSHSSMPLASQDDAIFSGHGNNLAGTRPLPAPTPVHHRDDGVAESKHVSRGGGDDGDVIDMGVVKQTGPMIDLNDDGDVKQEVKREPPSDPSGGGAVVAYARSKKREHAIIDGGDSESAPRIPKVLWRGGGAPRFPKDGFLFHDEAGIDAEIKKAEQHILKHQNALTLYGQRDVPIEGFAPEHPVSASVDPDDRKRIALSPNDLSLVPVMKSGKAATRKVLWNQSRKVQVKPLA